MALNRFINILIPPRVRVCAAIFLTVLTSSTVLAETQAGILKLTILDSETDKAVPARIEVLDADGNSYFAEDALPIGGSCGEMERNEGKPWRTIEYKGSSLKDALATFPTTIKDFITDKSYFYSTGQSTLKLPPGSFKIRVFKGPEYEVSHTEVKLVAGSTLKKSITLLRFVNMPAKGWYSADGHLHITRHHKGVDPFVLKLMQAEDIHVGNLLEIGRSAANSTAQQYTHGDKSLYQEGNYLITSGQENLRTHLLGHTITLGAEEFIYKPETYPLYRLAWQQAVDQGALNGYGHFGEDRLNLDPGLPIVAPYNLMHFIEVLQLNQGHYNAWYNMLNLGFRITPTAGTDYMCGGVLPGAERFFTKVEGPLTFKNWLEGVRAGRTFITTGPLLEFSINGQDIGSEVILPEDGEVTIKGEVHFQKRGFDHLFDEMMELELVENGEVVRRFPRLDNSGKISFEIQHKVQETSWLALRINSLYLNKFPTRKLSDTAHSAPIYVTLENKPPISEHPRTQAIAKKWLASLDALAIRISEDNIEYLYERDPKFIRGDHLPRQVLMDNHLALMKEIDHAKQYFQGFLKNDLSK